MQPWVTCRAYVANTCVCAPMYSLHDRPRSVRRASSSAALRHPGAVLTLLKPGAQSQNSQNSQQFRVEVH
eukprot:scaffold68696_cov17-Tisochrysis_lutea.AAC.1